MMALGVLLLGCWLGAAPPSAARAGELAKQKAWDQLLLTFAPVKPGAFSSRDAARVAEALTQACQALEKEDAVLAFDLGKHAATFKPIPDALLCWMRTARATEQRSSAEEALRLGLSRHPRDGRFGLELGRELIEAGDSAGALEALRHVPPKCPEAGEANLLTQRARALNEHNLAARRQASNIEHRLEQGKGSGTGSETVSGNPASGSHGSSGGTALIGSESGTGPGDIRTRDSRYFHFKYFNNKRDFGERAEFEGQVAGALEDARRHSSAQLGISREGPVDVILYTREEFTLHFGAQMARSVAGLYSAGAIRVNGALELTPDHRATLTHEYIHAVVDELAASHSERVPTWMNEGLAEYLEWRFQGKDDPPSHQQSRLRLLAQRNALPSLAALSQGALVAREDPGTLYAYSALAARALMHQAGAGAFVAALRDLGGGHKVEEVFPAHFATSLEDLDRSLAGDLAHR